MHRAEVMQLRGDWQDAIDEVERACEWLPVTAAHREIALPTGAVLGAAVVAARWT